MSGHSKWANIKRKKGLKDQERGKIFSKLSRLITLAVFEGNKIVDPDKNIRLRLTIEKAKEHNMPKENIQRAIDRATSTEASSLKEMVYEGFGPGGVSLLIIATTDNQNRTFNDIRFTIEKLGGKIGSPGSVLYNFQKCAIAILDKGTSEEELIQAAETLSAIDIDEEEDSNIIYFPFEKLGHADGFSAEPYYRPTNTITLTKQEDIDVLNAIVDAVEELDDVQKVYANVEIE